MSSENNPKYWFALKVFFNKVFDIETYLTSKDIESYIACEKVVSSAGGHKKVIRKPAISSLMFMRASMDDAASIQKDLNGKAFIYTSPDDKKKPAVIPDKEMDIFMLVSSSGDKGLEYLGEDAVIFRAGEKVRVKEGPLKGAEGHIVRVKGNKRLVVSVHGICAVATSYIPKCFLEKIPDES